MYINILKLVNEMKNGRESQKIDGKNLIFVLATKVKQTNVCVIGRRRWLGQELLIFRSTTFGQRITNVIVTYYLVLVGLLPPPPLPPPPPSS